MASTSASSFQKNFKYDVFLSFRGEDVRKNFVDHLYHALHQKGIITYKYDERIEKGERINDQLIRSIEESRFYIIVFSKIMECQKAKEQIVYPVFFDVEPTEVHNQSGAVGKAFAKHVWGCWSSVLPLDCLCSVVEICCNISSSLNGFTYMDNKDNVGRWRNALTEAAGLAGMELKNTFNGLKHEAKFIQQIVQVISLKLGFFNPRVDEKFVGMETRVLNVVSSLETGSDNVCMIGIKGMGGGGKTTLARAVFDHISVWFESKSFVENVREVSKSSLCGLKELQKKVLSDVLQDQSILETNTSDLEYMMKRMMPSRKALIVLDDVDDIDQLEALAGEVTWFKPGSRIIITTRDMQVLTAQRVNFIHDVNLLSNTEAICLFSRYAFGRDIPIQGYEELSGKVVKYAGGLPLTIKVLGSHLCGRTQHVWVDAIERLEKIPLEKTLKRLEISYDGLESDQKEIFLDVVCMLKGELKDRATRVLQSCGFNAQIGLSVLEQKSLIAISDRDGLHFHDHIEEMGRNIVRRMHPDDPSSHSRLWSKEEIEDILVNESGTEETKCLKLKDADLHPEIIMKGLRKMKKLRFLDMHNGLREWKLDEVNQYLPDALRSLCWFQYPFLYLPRTFKANKLVNLEMKGSNISQLWEMGERKVLDKLRWLDLGMSNLRTFDLGLTPHLETLDLSRCFNFKELHMRNECPNLKFLNLTFTKVSSLDLGMTPHLEELNLQGCKTFVEFHMPVECLELKYLNLGGSKISSFNLEMTPYLRVLDLKGCSYLEKIHTPVGCLKRLVYLKLDGGDDLDLSGVRFDRRSVLRGKNFLAMLALEASPIRKCQLHPNNSLPKIRFYFEY